MDIEALRYEHQRQWDRLEHLSKRRFLSGAEVDELVRHYQEVATQLSTIQTDSPDPALRSQLSHRVALARAVLANSNPTLGSSVRTFFTTRFPAALYRIRWWTVGYMLLFLALTAIVAINVVQNPAILDQFMTPAEQQEYVTHAFAAYYDPGITFTTLVWTNNAWLALVCVALGISGFMPVAIIVINAVNLGAVAGLMAIHGEIPLFLKLILPHGLLELTSVFVAAAAGFKLFWTLIDPGGRPRKIALAQEGRALFTVALGLVVVLGISGLVEGFITGSTLLWWIKIAIGAAVWATFVWYAWAYGKRLHKQGHIGDVEEVIVGATRPLAA